MIDEPKSESADPSAEGASADRQQRLEEVLAAFLADGDAGGEAGRRQLLAEHSDLADELAAFFQDHDRKLPRGVSRRLFSGNCRVSSSRS